MRFSGRSSYDPDPDSEYQQEPTIERGVDSAKKWWRVLVAVIIAGVVVGYVVSVSYTVYPFNVEVSGTFTSPDGSRMILVDFVECSDLSYATCPDPSQTPVDSCVAPPVMNVTNYCTEFYFEHTPGHYDIVLKNGYDYTMKAYMQFANGTFDKVCAVKVILSPALTTRDSTQNFSC